MRPSQFSELRRLRETYELKKNKFHESSYDTKTTTKLFMKSQQKLKCM